MHLFDIIWYMRGKCTHTRIYINILCMINIIKYISWVYKKICDIQYIYIYINAVLVHCRIYV